MRVAIFLVLLACSEPSTQVPENGSNVGEAPPAEVESVDDSADPCAQLRAETQAILQQSAAACSSDEECACYPAFIDCGGVRDAATAERLVEMDERRRAANCGYIDMNGSTFNCAPWECTPRCSHGVCVR